MRKLNHVVVVNNCTGKITRLPCNVVDTSKAQAGNQTSIITFVEDIFHNLYLKSLDGLSWSNLAK